jgi:hypothetical protein
LNERLDKLATEITELEAALAEATKIREQEQKENNQQIDDANAGQAAVEDATAILAQFYGTAKNKVKSQKDFEQFLQTSQGPEANDLPDAGFDEEYGASQDASVGVLGMLDVIKSDFIRTRETAESDEKQQAKDFADFSTATNASLAEKRSSESQYTGELAEQEDEIATNTDNLKAALKGLDMAVQELVELHAACVDTGMSYEERVARREEEIEALKDAFKILDNYKF